MRVRMVTQVSGTRDGAAWPGPGSVVDLPDDEAQALITGGSAVDVGADQAKVMVPPDGIHTPGVTALQEPGVTHLVAAPADAAADPEGVRQAMQDRAEGNVKEVPVGTGVQARSGAALSEEQVDASVEAEQATRDALASTAPRVSEPRRAKTTDAKTTKS